MYKTEHLPWSKEHTLQKLNRASEVIVALGGLKAVRDLTGVRGTQAVCNWITADKFPAHRYAQMKSELERRGFTACKQLWQQTDVSVSE